MDWILCCWRESATFVTAVTTLARQLAPHFKGTTIDTVADREALARLMCKTSRGKVEIGAKGIEWRLTDTERPDMEYRIV